MAHLRLPSALSSSRNSSASGPNSPSANMARIASKELFRASFLSRVPYRPVWSHSFQSRLKPESTDGHYMLYVTPAPCLRLLAQEITNSTGLQACIGPRQRCGNWSATLPLKLHLWGCSFPSVVKLLGRLMLPSLLPPMVLTNYVLSTIVFVVPIIFPTPRLTGRPLVILW